MSWLSTALQLVLGALIYGAAGLIGTMLAMALVPNLKRFEDGPEPVDVNPVALICGAALLGIFISWSRPPIGELLIGAVAAVALVAVWYCDAKTGLVPDVFTLVPLGIAFVYGFATHQIVQMLIASAVLFVPFAVAAALSKGKGMGWGDAKLAALAGALLGPLSATLALGVASLAAVIVTSVRHRSNAAPIAFAPYLVAGIALGIVLKAYQPW
jgi:prepilin signal peptidase PulO-like enzyme (type II secretory pathway)